MKHDERYPIVPTGANRFEVQQDGRRQAVFDRYEDAVLFLGAPALLAALEILISAVEREHKARDAFNLLNPRTAEADEVDEVCFELEDAAATVVIRESEARAAIAYVRGEP